MGKGLTILIAMFLISGCGPKSPPNPEPESRPAKLLSVSVGDSQFSRNFPAISEAGDKASLAFRVSGEVQSIQVKSGQQVHKGDKLAALNPDEYALLEKKANASYKLAEVQYKRYKKLHDDKIVSDQDFDEATANLKTAKADLEQAKANLSYTNLIAPYDGTISYVSADSYQFIAAKEEVMNIQTDQLLKIVFQLPDYLLQKFKEDENPELTMRFDAFPDQSYPLTFQEISTQADPKTGAYKVTLVMNRPNDIGVLPGMSGIVNVVIQSATATPIPKQAVIEENGAISVWKVNQDGSVEKSVIELSSEREVLSGLNDGDRIIVSGVRSVNPDTKVREWIKERGL
ncbi:efflux RND transporter periplasmic adaptor subunit [Vibrio sp. S4M6]|uniref:efflux RND transporter periplasmic adaptor subunit n=1 Tax=Vibrio sinus TaxID=2946865 RepID=UPI002029C2E7|nr:efflux RND transporter periplasmic adaptor subunit [Vibrio sinus]MCL9781247.1 efflux RND transporter periplasmic adaptor subunit [Vibrio sinus]